MACRTIIGVMLSRRLRSLLHRTLRRVWADRWIVLSVILTICAVVGLFSPIPVWLSVLLVVAGVALSVVEIAAYIRHRKEIHFAPRSDNRVADLEEAISDPARFTVLTFPSGTFVFDASFTEAVQGGRVLATLAPSAFRRAPEFADLAETFVERSEYLRFAHFDGHVAGLSTDIGTEGAVGDLDVVIVPGRYSDHVATNLFASRDVRVGRWDRKELGRRLFVDRHERLRDFGSSWLLNALGASVIAVTTDGKVIAVQQSFANQSSGGLLAPTGSGSLEPKDFKEVPRRDFAQLIGLGALREMREESGITSDDVAEWRFLGFGRWIEKGALPEGICIAFLGIDSHEALRRPIPKADAAFSLRKLALEIDLDSDVPVVDRYLHGQLSLPLAAGLALMVRAHRDSGSPLHAPLRSYG